MRSFRLMPLSTPLSTGFLCMQTTVNVHEFWTLEGGCFDVHLLDPLLLVPAPQMAPAPPLRPAPPESRFGIGAYELTIYDPPCVKIIRGHLRSSEVTYLG